MKRIFLCAAFIACLIIPSIQAGEAAGSHVAVMALPVAAGESPGAGVPPIPLFANISFPVRTPSAEDWYDRGFALTGEGRYQEAVMAYERALAANRSLLNAWYYLGDALFRLDRPGEALLAFQNATAIDPDFVDAYFYEGLIYGKIGLSREKNEALNRGLEAADRKNTGNEPVSRGIAGHREVVPQPVMGVIPLLGAGIAAGLSGYLRRSRG